LGLGDLVLLGKGEDRTGGREKSSVLADTLEAVVGALYLAAGMPAVLGFVDRHLGPALDGVAQGRNGVDHKTLLQEQAQQKLKLQPRYRIVGQSGPEHEKTFEVEVMLGDEPYATGSGRSKKEAEQAAASKALQRLAQTSAAG
jgi:ribonuclease-3